MYYHLIGKQSNKVKNVVERGLVKRFAESIRDAHPLFIDEQVGKQSRYGENIAPSTFPRVFDFGTVHGLNLPNKGLIHGEQVYQYERPLLVNEVLYCYTVIDSYDEKQGKNGLMGFLKIKRYGEDAHEKVVFMEESTIIITETVRKAMQV
ncbi:MULTISPECIES: MaoC family dehydratase N-terminal domain-containing protein [Virgibacillus]|uniref:FAS1-like dehydratase domain-containing protein n=1 Tax=Virgibacillus kapii TaxID=1638645 RepID=A0ABQ2DP93_9BACI|nr:MULTISPECIES: MaoC family dehydratase N-terminal domain-containing protein [Virgibacillus]EQB36848.1 hypothetical protein M948_10495 [Virgibacillus sp. CM-4]GGJ65683.1 hypothetical protein GCM10007111_29440 [Virgibacillus kapii]